jgi:aconitate hydratase
LCSPETATASALNCVITDPRSMDMPYPLFSEPDTLSVNTSLLVGPDAVGTVQELEKGPNIKPLPEFEPLSDHLEGPVLLKMEDDISTDEIMPAGAAVPPLRSNIPEISRFTCSRIDKSFYDRAMVHQKTGFFVVGGKNYGQGSSREHAALAPRYLGLRVVIAKSFARIHAQNLVNFGIVPLTFTRASDWNEIEQEDRLRMDNLINTLKADKPFEIQNLSKNRSYTVAFALSARQLDVLTAGGLINHIRRTKQPTPQ